MTVTWPAKLGSDLRCQAMDEPITPPPMINVAPCLFILALHCAQDTFMGRVGLLARLSLGVATCGRSTRIIAGGGPYIKMTRFSLLLAFGAIVLSMLCSNTGQADTGARSAEFNWAAIYAALIGVGSALAASFAKDFYFQRLTEKRTLQQ